MKSQEMNRIAIPSTRRADPDAAFRQGLLELLPFLRAFSRSLCGNRDLADDLAQEALAKAWQARKTFRPGSNLKAWLFTILRNQFYSDRRRAWRQAPWDESAADNIPAARDEQTWAVHLSDVARALLKLPDEQREALILVGAGGFSYEEAASICKCVVGTVKSRVARARKALIRSLDGKDRLPLHTESPPAKGDAAHEIMAQLDQLVSPQARSASTGRRSKRSPS